MQKERKPRIRYDKNQKVLLRKKRLFDELNNERLEYRQNGICDAYIKFGKPSLEEVIDTVQKKSEKEMKRLRALIRKLKKEGEVYDDSISYYKQYIKNGGSLQRAVSEGIKERFYINKTNYLELLDKYRDDDKAQARALNQYIKKNGTDKYTEMIRNTEMTLRIY